MVQNVQNPGENQRFLLSTKSPMTPRDHLGIYYFAGSMNGGCIIIMGPIENQWGNKRFLLPTLSPLRLQRTCGDLLATLESLSNTWNLVENGPAR